MFMGGCKYISNLWRSRQLQDTKLLSNVRYLEYTATHSSLHHTRPLQPADHRPFGEVKKLYGVFKSAGTQSTVQVCTSHKSKDILGANGIPVLLSGWFAKKHTAFFPPPYLLRENHGVNSVNSSFARFISSSASDKPGKNTTEANKEISTMDDPSDDAPTYNIPQKPVTFVEGASYSVIILAGIGIAAAAAYGVFKELIFEPKEYKIYGKALKRIQDDSQVRVRIGSPITGYGQESRNRAARQRIPNRIWTDEDGVEHVEVNFYIRGPHGHGKVFSEMFKDQVDKQWKFTYLIVEIKSPSTAQLILESYIPAYNENK
ncbi:hypothetical protein L6164_033517 [Bauhinia variegata]|uniref:Uncharacterized protein n=1 Tax=Bauhinia variegata TaxID=167791 RepID=A0ACB9KST3_BAUVA|nr:hypothetical protein L6164_033517 [Bauhinia variegata]